MGLSAEISLVTEFLSAISRLFNGVNRQLTPPITANKNSQFTQLAVAQQRNVFRRSPCIKCLRAEVRLQSVLGANDDLAVGAVITTSWKGSVRHNSNPAQCVALGQ